MKTDLPTTRVFPWLAEPRRSSTGLLGFGLAILVGCGGKAVVDPYGGGGTGGTPTTSSSSTSSSTSTSTSTSSSGVEITIVDSTVGAGCMPDVPPDPLYVDFVLWVDNTAAGAETVTAFVGDTWLEGSEGETTFMVTPPTTEPLEPGGFGEYFFSKLPDSAAGTDGCAWCGASEVTLHVDLQVNQQPDSLSTPVSVGCAY